MDTDALTVSAREADGRTIVDVRGNVDEAGARQLQGDLIRLIAGSSFRLVVDLDQATGVSSAVRPVLDDAARRVERFRGSVKVVGSQPQVLEALGSDEPGTSYTLHRSLEDALAPDRPAASASDTSPSTTGPRRDPPIAS